MPSYSKYVALAAALLMVSAPLMACAFPGIEMTQAEQSCCKEMSADCGSMQMADSHSCCKQSPRASSDSLPVEGKNPSPASAQAPAVSVLLAMPEARSRFEQRDDSLIKLKPPPGRQTVLRI